MFTSVNSIRDKRRAHRTQNMIYSHYDSGSFPSHSDIERLKEACNKFMILSDDDINHIISIIKNGKINILSDDGTQKISIMLKTNYIMSTFFKDNYYHNIMFFDSFD
jgi:hypothetical protein